jgi:hypothetical protein
VNATVRVRFGFRLPLMPNALIVVDYMTPDSFKKLEGAVNTVKTVAPVLGERAASIAAMLVCESAEKK